MILYVNAVTEVMVSAMKFDAVTDDLKNFQASTGTALAGLSDRATATATTMGDVRDELKKGAEAQDALLAQFVALKDQIVIERAFDAARIAKLESGRQLRRRGRSGACSAARYGGGGSSEPAGSNAPRSSDVIVVVGAGGGGEKAAASCGGWRSRKCCGKCCGEGGCWSAPAAAARHCS